MPSYPATLADLQSRVSLLDYLSARSDDEQQQALDLAQGEIELACPQAYDDTLGDRLTLAAWGLHLELGVWQLRMSVERDAETGMPPRDLETARRLLDARLSALKAAAEAGPTDVLFAASEGLGDAPLPGDVLTTPEETL